MSYAIHNHNLAFNDSAIAQYMNTDFIVIDISLCVALAREQFFEKLKDDDIPSHIFIEDNGRLAGLIAVRKLLQATDTVQPVKGLMISDFIQLKPEDERADVAGLLAHAGADVVPVVTHGKLVGCLTEREIAHLLEDDVTEDAQLQGATLPLEKPYLETSAFSLWKKRSVWLLLLLFVAEAYTSSVIQHFEEALESAIALAFFIPLLIGTGGNSGTQITSTLVRAMALGEVHLRDVGRVLRKEMSTSLMIAATLGLAGCVRAWMMGIGMEITLIVSLTLVCITLWSAIVSSVIPMVLKRCKIDPAVVSAPFIATLIDGTGLIIYFKIAQYTLGLE
ncbi:magnesium transporter [Enterobacter hormaechei]